MMRKIVFLLLVVGVVAHGQNSLNPKFRTGSWEADRILFTIMASCVSAFNIDMGRGPDVLPPSIRDLLSYTVDLYPQVRVTDRNKLIFIILTSLLAIIHDYGGDMDMEYIMAIYDSYDKY